MDWRIQEGMTISLETKSRILCVNTAGAGDLHGIRMRRLAEYLPESSTVVTHIDLDKSNRRQSSRELWDLLTTKDWDLVYQESTGIAGGLPLIRAARKRGLKYIVSSGDPISGFFRVTRGPVFAAPFEIYERSLYRNCAGFIGWTPYLVGRALELGASRAVTIEGAVDTDLFTTLPAAERQAARARLGLPQNHLVCGVVGTLKWVERQSYCYGLELIETLKRVQRPDVSVLIVGDGDGRARLEALVPAALRSRVIFTGRLLAEDVVSAMNAMDVGFITQTLDTLGNYRLTTKMPEYLACGIPIAMSPIPGYFDYVGSGAGWALPARHPAHPSFHALCARWMDTLDDDEITRRSLRCREIACRRFAYPIIGPRFAAFVEDVTR